MYRCSTVLVRYLSASKSAATICSGYSTVTAAWRRTRRGRHVVVVRCLPLLASYSTVLKSEGSTTLKSEGSSTTYWWQCGTHFFKEIPSFCTNTYTYKLKPWCSGRTKTRNYSRTHLTRFTVQKSGLATIFMRTHFTLALPCTCLLGTLATFRLQVVANMLQAPLPCCVQHCVVIKASGVVICYLLWL